MKNVFICINNDYPMIRTISNVKFDTLSVEEKYLRTNTVEYVSAVQYCCFS